MSSGMSSDQIVKYEIRDTVTDYRSDGIICRIFTEGSDQDQLPIEKGGLTFSYSGVDYGSCDAGWFYRKKIGDKTVYEPLIGLEGTDALNRGSSGNAQYQRFHHALGAVKSGYIGIYYLRKGSSILQPDLYEMAYNATIHEEGPGAYLIIQDLSIVNEILSLIVKHGFPSKAVSDFVVNYVTEMHEYWKTQKFSQYKCNWQIFADKRSTILGDDYIIKYTGRMKRNFTDGSQRAGHIAVGEMYLSKYLFYGKKVYYLCPRMSQADVDELDRTKKDDKEWALLRNEPNVFYKTRDDIIGLPENIRQRLISVESSPLKGEALKNYNDCLKIIVHGLKTGKFKLKK